ncbi:hypothetical protein M436DRAFT_76755 [Aureobasidium namibiae CBS 147.97]|uniref:Uncharacterized protein n=1 Tax=Aureobasidium namibiae CBS 147.97 TaxID=1043004 RepID=A0A074W721_9PEZI|nr:uncharacterized protein M436DRAFT_76755 [Aureobasidium namibiae CBS 147.97]KEQ68648.1 hypothetical protein M436DRAFT_76755 [Aureobasidium namibiae CBS 147.97]
MLFPIVCAAPLSKELMNHFISVSGIDTTDTADFVFIDNMSTHYSNPSTFPVSADSNPCSPFMGKSPTEIWEMLVKLCKDTGSEIMVWYVIVLDERSERDGTVLLVTDVGDVGEEDGGGDGDGDGDGEEEGEEEDGGGRRIQTVRATFEVAAEEVVLFHTGHRGIEEDQWKAEKDKDGVFRG